MKKIFLVLSIALLTVSCTTVVKTAKTAETPVSLLSATVADLEVIGNRDSYTWNNVPKEYLRAGLGNVKRAAEAELLKKHGADVLVNPEYVITMKNYFFKKEVESITVSGRPAKYKNFHSLGDKVWTDPVFRGTYKESGSGNNGSILNKLLGK